MRAIIFMAIVGPLAPKGSPNSVFHSIATSRRLLQTSKPMPNAGAERREHQFGGPAGPRQPCLLSAEESLKSNPHCRFSSPGYDSDPESVNYSCHGRLVSMAKTNTLTTGLVISASGRRRHYYGRPNQEHASSSSTASFGRAARTVRDACIGGCSNQCWSGGGRCRPQGDDFNHFVRRRRIDRRHAERHHLRQHAGYP